MTDKKNFIESDSEHFSSLYSRGEFLKIVVSLPVVLVAGKIISRGWFPDWMQVKEVHAASIGTYQDFDVPNTGTPYTEGIHPPSTSGPALIAGGPTEAGQFMRLAFADLPIPTHNCITFDLTDSGTFDQIIADFDFRMTPGTGRADGIGFALLNTADYPTGNVPPEGPLFAAEEPNFKNSLGVGFDIHQADGEINGNHVSIHFNKNLVQEFDVTPVVILSSGQWIHARIIMRPGGGFWDVTVILTQWGRSAMTIVNQLQIPGFTPYEGRIHFAARSGGESANHDIDNVHVQFLTGLSHGILAFSTGCYSVVETDSEVEITVVRTGNANELVTIDYATADNTALDGSDYTAKSDTLIFNSGETEKTFTVQILDDPPPNEGHESFLVSLSNPTGSNVVLGGPATAKVRIIDDEIACLEGYWQAPFSVQIVAVHAHLLPMKKVMFWPGDEGEAGSEGSTFDDPRIWDPVTEIFESTVPPHNLFCSGHAFLADGRLFVAGGHQGLNEGLPNAAIYDPFNNTWISLPEMNAGRWYPTCTILGNGDVLVVSGSIMDAPFTVNQLPQVWEINTGDWRDLDNASFTWDLYPFMFLVSDGRVFNAGPNPNTRFIDTFGTGQLDPGPQPSSQYRSDGSAVMYDDDKILIVGGSSDPNPPTATAQVIDLNNGAGWQTVDPMAFPRKYHNATLLPDGTVLVTGGTSTGGFNDASDAVLPPELWNPETGMWTTLAELQIPRVYHSTALLLPDGRVFVSGGGQPSPADHADNKDAEIFSPPYLFKGPRPTITSAQTGVLHGDTFPIGTPDADNIDKVTLIRLSSVTHAFNQNQRINHLNFQQISGGLNVTIPSNPNLVPPGHYMLFIVNNNGVPSMAHCIQVGRLHIRLPRLLRNSPN